MRPTLYQLSQYPYSMRGGLENAAHGAMRGCQAKTGQSCGEEAAFGLCASSDCRQGKKLNSTVCEAEA